jgi:hypothetical protein
MSGAKVNGGKLLRCLTSISVSGALKAALYAASSILWAKSEYTILFALSPPCSNSVLEGANRDSKGEGKVEIDVKEAGWWMEWGQDGRG